MMRDRLKSTLTDFYSEAIKKAFQVLKNNYIITECNKNDDDYPKEYLDGITNKFKLVRKIEVPNEAYPFTLIIGIPKTFPDEWPKLFLSKQNYSNFAPIPHISKDRSICIRDINIASINDNKIEDSVIEIINIAKDIINSGIKKENFSDFSDEFIAYWNDEETEIKSLSLFVPSDNIERLKLFKLSTKIGNYEFIIAKNINEVFKWLKPLKIGIEDNVVLDALYLPLPKPFPLPFPKNNKEIYNLLVGYGQEYLKAAGQYFAQRGKYFTILFSCPVKGEKILAGWRHEPWPAKCIFHNGFRPNKAPLLFRINKSAQVPIKKIRIERIDNERLFKRSGLNAQKKSIAVVGCGSLGSSLAISLSKCGISKFLLIDKELIEPENIARHICGMGEIYHSKSVAIKTRLQTHFPHIVCDAYIGDILNLLQDQETFLSHCDLTVIALGSYAIERRLNYLHKRKVISTPLLYIWMEPFGVAGQMLYISPDNGGCYQCCFDINGKFIYSVAKENKEFHKQECGCQNTYIPYSNLEIEHFISIAGKIILKLLEDKPSSLLYTWLGDLQFFKSLGFKINDRWQADNAYTLHKKNINKYQNCTGCKMT